jgi:hypothetical protein
MGYEAGRPRDELALEPPLMWSFDYRSHLGGAREAQIEWATVQQREHKTASFVMGLTHTRQLTARRIAR